MTQETSISANPFYRAYERQGQGTVLKKKHIRQFRKDFVDASGFRTEMSVLELGCGNGLFLRFLESIGVANFWAVDGDARVLAEIPASLADKVTISDFESFIDGLSPETFIDRIVLFDVLEHFSTEGAVDLLSKLRTLLSDDGKIVLRVPNMGSPLALGMQYNDLTHLSAFSAGSLSQVGRVAGFSDTRFFPQAYSSRGKEIRERLLTRFVSAFLSAPPMIWSPALIAVFTK